MDRRRGVRGAKSIGYLYDYPLLPINHDERSSSSPRTLLRGARVRARAAMDARERADNLERHAEEAEALGAIYGDDFSSDADGAWRIRVSLIREDDAAPRFAADGSPAPAALTVRVIPLDAYPSRAPPAVEIEPASALPFARYDVAMRAVDEAFADAAGEVLVFAFVERLRALIEEWRAEDHDDADAAKPDISSPRRDDLAADLAASALEASSLAACSRDDDDDRRDDRSASASATASAGGDDRSFASRERRGTAIVDRKSAFVARLCAPVRSVREAEAFIAHVTSDPKCSKASHNVSAYRVAREGTRGPGPPGRTPGSDHSEGTADLAFAADHDDDGEHGAGRGLSHLLHVTDARNVCVVVSRWFGGIHLGPDRFKHINNAARILLEDAGVIEPRGATTKEKQQRGGGGARAASHRAR